MYSCYTWRFVNDPLDQSINLRFPSLQCCHYPAPNMEHSDPGMLQIQQASLNMSGEYSCIVTNENGSKKRTFRLEVTKGGWHHSYLDNAYTREPVNTGLDYWTTGLLDWPKSINMPYLTRRLTKNSSWIMSHKTRPRLVPLFLLVLGYLHAQKDDVWIKLVYAYMHLYWSAVQTLMVPGPGISKQWLDTVYLKSLL